MTMVSGSRKLRGPLIHRIFDLESELSIHLTKDFEVLFNLAVTEHKRNDEFGNTLAVKLVPDNIASLITHVKLVDGCSLVTSLSYVSERSVADYGTQKLNLFWSLNANLTKKFSYWGASKSDSHREQPDRRKI